ncbi:MAG TPA: glycosyltransferase, partial [Sphingobacteriaceae bacterium]
MKVLFVTNMYPTKEHPADGVFVKEQIDSITQAFKCQYDLYYINAKQKGKLNYLISLLALPFKIRSSRYQIIHIHYGISGLFLLLFKPRLSKIFLTLHGGDILDKQGYFIQVFLTKRILSRVDKVFLQNEEMKDIVREYNKNYEIIPCGVNSEFFRPITIYDKADVNTRLIIFPSSPDRWEKNFQLFADAMEHLKKTSSYKIEFDCLHNLSRSEVRELLNRADCLLLTSISEGSPQV